MLRSGPRNRPQISNQLLLGHPNPGVLNRQHPILLVRPDMNLQRPILLGKVLLPLPGRMDRVPELLQRIASVRNQLPHENLLVRVQRPGHNVQQHARLRLELVLVTLADGLLRVADYRVIAGGGLFVGRRFRREGTDWTERRREGCLWSRCTT